MIIVSEVKYLKKKKRKKGNLRTQIWLIMVNGKGQQLMFGKHFVVLFIMSLYYKVAAS